MSAGHARQEAAQPPNDWIVPQWPAAGCVRALFTTRAGGVSEGPWGDGAQGGMNLGMASGDAVERVARNRALLNAYLPQPPRWLSLQHGARVVEAEGIDDAPVAADASTSCTPGVVCAVTVADCLPVLLAARSGTVVAAAHAGWRGIAAGILQATVEAIRARAGSCAGPIDAFIGPSIGPQSYEVGQDVLAAMRRTMADAQDAFEPAGNGKMRADLRHLARKALAQAGVDSVHGGTWCTFADARRFYSFRRDATTGRHAALIWIKP